MCGQVSLAGHGEHLKSFSLRVPGEMSGLCRSSCRQVGQAVLQHREQEGRERNRLQFLAFGWEEVGGWFFLVFGLSFCDFFIICFDKDLRIWKISEDSQCLG